MMNLEDGSTNPVVIQSRKFPKYVSPLINLANLFSQATRPKYVGKVKDLIAELDPSSPEEWATWYVENHGNEMRGASLMIMKMLEEFRSALDKVDHRLVNEWVKDLILNKTYTGTYTKRVIRQYLREQFDRRFAFPTQDEESDGIDCKIDDVPFSIVPHKPADLAPGHHVIYYEEKKNGDLEIYGAPNCIEIGLCLTTNLLSTFPKLAGTH